MVKYLEQSYRVSQRHACCVLEVARATHRYEGQQEQWIELRMRIREIAQTRVRYGYRMIRVLLNREGWKVGKDLVYRLYKEEGLGLRKRPAGKRTCGSTSAGTDAPDGDQTRSGRWTSARHDGEEDEMS